MPKNLVIRRVLENGVQRTGLCAGMGFEKRLPGTAAD